VKRCLAPAHLARLASVPLVIGIGVLACCGASVSGCSADENGGNRSESTVGAGGEGGNDGGGFGGKGTGGTATGATGGNAPGGSESTDAQPDAIDAARGVEAGGSESTDAQPDVSDAACNTHLIFFSAGCGDDVKPTCTDYELCTDFLRCGCDGQTYAGCFALVVRWVHEGACGDSSLDSGSLDSGRD
jgi:hypothetical protein